MIVKTDGSFAALIIFGPCVGRWPWVIAIPAGHYYH